MSGIVQLLALERDEGAARIVVRLKVGSALEVAFEARTLESWTLGRRVVFSLDELELLRDAVDRAIAIRNAGSKSEAPRG